MRELFAHNWWARNSHHSTLTVLLLISLFMLGAILLSAYGVRGTDQYWYLADVTTLINGGAPLSNLYFPRIIFEDRDHANFFIHNSPVLHLSALFGAVLGPFKGWIVVNTISHLVTATCIYFASRKYTGHAIATVCCFLYLTSPVAIWQTLNMMQEQFLGALLAIILLLFSYRHTTTSKLILPLVLILCVAIHPLFLAITTAYVLINLYKALEKQSFTDLTTILFFSFLCSGMYYIYPLIFPTTFPPTLLTTIRGSVPNVSSMLWHYSDTLPQLNATLMSVKASAAIRAHISGIPAYFYTIAALSYTAYLVVFKRTRMRSIEFLLCFVLVLYAAMSVLMQAQPRYQQIFAPATFLLIALSLRQTRQYFSHSIRNLLLTGASAAAITVGIFLCYTAHLQSTQESISIAELSSELNALPQSSNILLFNSEHETKLGYLLSPRKVLSVKSELLTLETYRYTISQFRPDYIISTSPVDSFPLSHEMVSTTRASYLGNFYLYELDHPELALTPEWRSSGDQSSSTIARGRARNTNLISAF